MSETETMTPVGQPRLVLCEFRVKGRIVKRWVRPDKVVEAQHGCGCAGFMYAKDAGRGKCLDCYSCNPENAGHLARKPAPQDSHT